MTTNRLIARALIIPAATFAFIVTALAQIQADAPSAPFYGPSPEHPYGRLNPKAPPETEQLAFMIGEFDRIDRDLQSDGTWEETRGEWNAAYVMDGYAVYDQHRNFDKDFRGSNMRIFDAEKGKWTVTWFKMPSYKSLVIDGQKIGDNIVMSKGDDQQRDRYVFFDITPDSYKWRLELTRDGSMLIVKEIICTRRK